MVKDYLILTKPGIIAGNLITAIGGFFLVHQITFDKSLFLGMILGLSGIIGSGCVFNNYMDRSIDEKMKRTKTRSLVSGTISSKNAFIYGCILFLISSFILLKFTNLYSFIFAVVGFIIYVGIYTPLKKTSAHATLIGSIAGAMPPVVGYTAKTGYVDFPSLVLFLIVAFWQMPHFYSIGLYRMEEYEEAKIPILPIVEGVKKTKQQIFFYTVLFFLMSLLPFFLNLTSKIYFLIILLLGFFWIVLAWQGFSEKNFQSWAKKMFRFSLVIILIQNILLCYKP